MKVTNFESREDWLAGRVNRITGTKLKDLIVKRGTGKKIQFYQLIADRLAVVPDEENPMDRGQRLEEIAISRFAEETGKEVDTRLIICSREDNDSIAFSPDALVVGEKAVVEAKCLSSAKHLEAFITQKIPSEYEEQSIQPFIVDDSLETVYFVFFDDRIPCKDYFVIEVHREDIEEQITEYLQYEKDVLEEVKDIVSTLSNF